MKNRKKSAENSTLPCGIKELEIEQNELEYRDFLHIKKGNYVKVENKLLTITDLHTSVEDKKILKGLNLEIGVGEIHVIMGPNGAGKSTLANAIFNNPSYAKDQGSIVFDGQDITQAKTSDIAQMGLFMSFQSPEEISGISVMNFLKTAKNNITGQPVKTLAFQKALHKTMDELNMKQEYSLRDLNVGFSGGEKKKNEILQMLTLSPKLSILDETDSGLDTDAIRTVSKGISMYHHQDNSVLIITHNTKLLESLKVDYVHILVDGKIVKTGSAELASTMEQEGYSQYTNGGDGSHG